MIEKQFQFRSLMHTNSEDVPARVTIEEIATHAPLAREYLERLWQRQVVRNFYAKLERHARQRVQRTPTEQTSSEPCTLTEDDYEVIAA